MPVPRPDASSTFHRRRPWPALAIVLAGGLAAAPALAQAISAGPSARTPPFDRAWPCLPEGVVMALEILQGGRFGPGMGWFVPGKSTTRFTWDRVVARLDADGDGMVSRREFPGPDADFRELDRDRSGRLKGDDFEFPVNALEKCRSRMIMSFADGDHDGKIDPREFRRMAYLAYRDQITRFIIFADALDDVDRRFQASEKAGTPYLTLSDLRRTVDLRARMDSLTVPPNRDVDFESEVSSRDTLLKALIGREIGGLWPGPSLGDAAPDFTLTADDGPARVGLAKLLVGRRPVVLIFGNYTSPGFRNEAGTLEKLYHRYRDRAEFLLVYVREQHPSGGWALRENIKAGISVAQPVDDAARLALARLCRKKLGLKLPMVVDGVDDRVGLRYSGLPDRLYLLDPRGSIAYKGGRGPYGFKPDELEQSLILLLSAEAASPAGPTASSKAP